MTALLELGAAFGALQSGYAADKISRRYVLMLGTAWFVIGSTSQTAAFHFPMLIVGRFIGGVGILHRSFFPARLLLSSARSLFSLLYCSLANKFSLVQTSPSPIVFVSYFACKPTMLFDISRRNPFPPVTAISLSTRHCLALLSSHGRAPMPSLLRYLSSHEIYFSFEFHSRTIIISYNSSTPASTGR